MLLLRAARPPRKVVDAPRRGIRLTLYINTVKLSPAISIQTVSYTHLTLPAINTDASKHEKELISRTVQEMFEEADMWLTEE